MEDEDIGCSEDTSANTASGNDMTVEYYARGEALRLAHDRDLSPKDVISRAEEYSRFLIG